MNQIRIVALLILVLCSAVAAEPSDDAKRLMKDITINARDLVVLTFPRPPAPDWPGDQVADATRFVERDLAKLKNMDPTLLTSPMAINGTPFAHIVRDATATIAANKAAAAAASTPRNAVVPPSDAGTAAVAPPSQPANAAGDQMLMMALRVGQQGIRILAGKDPDRLAKAAVQATAYKNMLAEVLARDPKAVEQVKEDMAVIERDLLVPIQNHQAAELAKEQARKADATAKLEADKGARIRAARERAEDAKKRGFESAETGLLGLVISVRDRELTLEKAKKILVYPSPDDDFTVTNVVDNVAIFSAKWTRTEVVQVAVIKSPNVFYGTGSPLEEPRLRLKEVRTFTRAIGGQVELLVFERVD